MVVRNRERQKERERDKKKERTDSPYLYRCDLGGVISQNWTVHERRGHQPGPAACLHPEGQHLSQQNREERSITIQLERKS